jgi:hypothetical protein
MSKKKQKDLSSSLKPGKAKVAVFFALKIFFYYKNLDDGDCGTLESSYLNFKGAN